MQKINFHVKIYSKAFDFLNSLICAFISIVQFRSFIYSIEKQNYRNGHAQNKVQNCFYFSVCIIFYIFDNCP